MSDKYERLIKNIKNGTAKCYICGYRAKYLTASKKPCCKERAFDCSGYSEYIGGRISDAYKSGRKKVPWAGGSRPEHKLKLLKLNDKGTLGQSGWWHKKARELYHTGYCEICGKTEQEQLKQMNKGLHMHCIDEDYTNLKPDNWQCLCHRHHRMVHAEWYKEEQSNVCTENQCKIRRVS